MKNWIYIKHDYLAIKVNIKIVMPCILLVVFLWAQGKGMFLHTCIVSASKALYMLECAFVWHRRDVFQNPQLACVGGVNLKNYLNLGLCDLALPCDDYSSPWLFDWLITHDMAFLSPQSTLSHFISLKQANYWLCHIFGKEKINWWHSIRKVIVLGLDQDHTPFWTEQQQRKGLEEWEHILELFGPARVYRTCPVCYRTCPVWAGL